VGFLYPLFLLKGAWLGYGNRMQIMDVNKKEILKNIAPVIRKACGTLGLIPIEIDFKNESGRWFLRIFIYSEKHDIIHKDCEALTKALGDAFEETIAVPYFLEVSSPGLDRKLKSSEEYNIFKNKDVLIKLKNSSELEIKKFKAKLVSFDENIGLAVFVPEINKEIILKEKDISSVRLDCSFV